MTYSMVQDLSSADHYAPAEWPERKRLPPGVSAMPPGHCMFVDPYGYGKVPVVNGGATIPAADLPRVREIIVGAMRAYWHVARRDHTWREIYPEKIDARAVALALARFMSDRGIRFPREAR